MARKVKKGRARRETKNMMGRVRWILEIPDSPETWRGLEKERYVIQALEYHRKKKTQFPGGRRIIEIIPTRHFSADDRSGKDAFIKFQTGPQSDSDYETLPIQIRGWWEEGAERRFKERGICLIKISLFHGKNKKTQDEIKKGAREKILSAISYFYKIC